MSMTPNMTLNRTARSRLNVRFATVGKGDATLYLIELPYLKHLKGSVPFDFSQRVASPLISPFNFFNFLDTTTTETDMPWTIEAALDDEAIEKTETTGQGYSFWLKGIPVEIQVILSINPSGGFNFHLSHFIHTPKQIGPYHPSHPWGDDQAYALHLAVTAITQYYKDAINAGLAPGAKWLVPNKRGI